MNNANNLASGGQNARLGLIITNGVIDAIEGHFTVDEMQQILKNEAFIRGCSKEIVSKLLSIQLDLWSEQKKKVERFYKSIFNYAIDWSQVDLPKYDEKYPRLEYVHLKFNCKKYLDAYKKKFGDESIVVNSYSQNPDTIIKNQQYRPEMNYCFARKDTIEPDAEHLNKSHNDFCYDTNFYMIPKEGIIAAFRERFESGNMFDVKSFTRFHALDSDGHAILMRSGDNGRFYIDYDNCVYRYSVLGPRQINF